MAQEMPKRIVYRTPQGRVCVVTPAREPKPFDGLRVIPPVQDCVDAAMKKLPPDAQDVRVIDTVDLPKRDPKTRDAWTWDGQSFGIDPLKVKP